MSRLLQKLLNAILSRKARVGILGLGHVGLPLAQAFTTAGFHVLGFETNPERVSCLRDGRSYLQHLCSEEVRHLREQGFEVLGKPERLAEPDALLICVPSSLTEASEPDLSCLMAAVRSCAEHLRAGQLVVIESTVCPGTTRQKVLPLLEQQGLKVGEDFFLACSPEREDPGNSDHPMATIPKVVGAVDPASLQAATALYSRVVCKVVRVASPECAEACKLLENSYRAVNIALVNELKVLFEKMGIGIWEVIEAARTKPFGFQAFYPGPGLGGACIPVNPFYLSWAAREQGLQTRLIDLSGEINDAMPAYVVERLADALRDRGKTLRDSRVLLLGVAYKKDVNDCRQSPALPLMDQLLKQGAMVDWHDPHVSILPETPRYRDLAGERVELSPPKFGEYDAVVIVTDHSAYDWHQIVEQADLVLDTRNATSQISRHRDRIVRA